MSTLSPSAICRYVPIICTYFRRPPTPIKLCHSGLISRHWVRRMPDSLRDTAITYAVSPAFESRGSHAGTHLYRFLQVQVRYLVFQARIPGGRALQPSTTIYPHVTDACALIANRPVTDACSLVANRPVTDACSLVANRPVTDACALVANRPVTDACSPVANRPVTDACAQVTTKRINVIVRHRSVSIRLV
jgi:hypothetical protein